MNTEKSNEFMNKSNEIFEKCSQRVSEILKETNWKLERVDPTYKGAYIAISLDGERNTILELLWKAQTKRREESFVTNVRTTGSFEIFSGTSLGTEANFYKEVGCLLSNVKALIKIKEAAKALFNELNALEKEYIELQNED